MDALCGAQAARCWCIEPAGHADEVHVCDCGGAWTGSHEDDTFVIVALPGSNLLQEEIERLDRLLLARLRPPGPGDVP